MLPDFGQANKSADVFNVPTSRFLSYELRHGLPYFVKRHILRKKIEEPAPITWKADVTTA